MKPILGIALFAALGVTFLAQAGQEVKVKGVATASPQRADKVVMSDAQWLKKLGKERYEILRAKGTEPAFCGVNLEKKKGGHYDCAGCGLTIFDAKSKFDSGTGWPSFYRAAAPDRVWFQVDSEMGMKRTEILCARCDGHLGHVFNDSPTPTGLRYCINGKVLNFVKDAPKTKKG